MAEDTSDAELLTEVEEVHNNEDLSKNDQFMALLSKMDNICALGVPQNTKNRKLAACLSLRRDVTHVNNSKAVSRRNRPVT